MALFPPIEESPEVVRAALAPLRNDLSVAIHSLGNPFAVGAIIRVAHSFLVRELIIVGDAPYYEKASMGMEKYETIVRVPDDEAFFAHAGRTESPGRGRRPVWAIEKDGARRSLYDGAGFPPGVIFVFGSERGGLAAEFLSRADEVVGIPMYGVNHSFPVAVAAGMVLGEWGRRRYGGGQGSSVSQDK
jgi:tRNA G18 (ribose-2'-O)-methylase SpoU